MIRVYVLTAPAFLLLAVLFHSLFPLYLLSIAHKDCTIPYIHVPNPFHYSKQCPDSHLIIVARISKVVQAVSALSPKDTLPSTYDSTTL